MPAIANENSDKSKVENEPADNGVSPKFDEKIALVARRPMKGKSGKEVQVITNSFSIQTPLNQIHLYLIEFNPELPEDANEQRLSIVNSRSIRDKIITEYGPYFFENRHMLCIRKVTGEKEFANPEMTQSIVVKYLKSVDLKDLSNDKIENHEQIMHWMLNKVIRCSDLIRIGANYFERNEPLFSSHGKFDISEPRCPDIRIWRGFTIALERRISGVHMNIDSVHRVLHRKSVGEKMAEIFKTAPNQNVARRRVEEMLLNNVVITIYNRRLYRINEIDWTINIDDTFMKGDEKISYRDYIKNTYNETCEMEMKGLLVHNPRPRKNNPNPGRVVLVPELCHETGLSKKLKSNFRLMKKIADTTRIRADEKHRLRGSLVKRMQEAIGVENNYDTDSVDGSQKGKQQTDVSSSSAQENFSEVSAESQIPMILSSKAIQVTARELPKFNISIADQNNKLRNVDPYTELQSGWNNGRFVNAKIHKISSWAILAENPRMADICLSQIKNVAGSAGLLNSYITKLPITVIVRRNNRGRNNSVNWKMTLEEIIQKRKPQMIVCVLPDERDGNPTAIYNQVKTYCCTEVPCLTQCITTRNIMNQRRANTVFKGMLKQILTKMGNTPWRANFALPDNSFELGEDTMICGMDVNHDLHRNSSTVSFVASYTDDFTQYNTFIYDQKHGREVLIEGSSVMLGAVKRFCKLRGFLPKKIIVYRDGVSTSQLSTIVLQEVRAYKQTFANIKVNNKPYSPKLSIVVTQKNISARFVNLKHQSLNPGTVIDSVVVSSKFWDFYLIPCTATNRATTASPTRFIVAYDEIHFSQDDISALTNQLCNVYFNIAAAVRVPAPIQNAHKLAHMYGGSIEKKEICPKLVGKPFYL